MTHDVSLLTASEVARRLAVNPETVRRWHREGRVPAIVLPGGSLRFPEADIDALLAPAVAEHVEVLA